MHIARHTALKWEQRCRIMSKQSTKWKSLSSGPGRWKLSGVILECWAGPVLLGLVSEMMADCQTGPLMHTHQEYGEVPSSRAQAMLLPPMQSEAAGRTAWAGNRRASVPDSIIEKSLKRKLVWEHGLVERAWLANPRETITEVYCVLKGRELSPFLVAQTTTTDKPSALWLTKSVP